MRRERPDALIQHIHHQALRRFRQCLGEALRQHEGRAQIGFNVAVPGFARRILPFIAFKGGRVIHQHPQRAERLAGFRDQPRDFRFLAEFGLQRDGTAAKGADFGGRGLSRFGAGGIMDGDIKAGFSKRERHGAAKPLAGAGDQRGGGDVGRDHARRDSGKTRRGLCLVVRSLLSVPDSSVNRTISATSAASNANPRRIMSDTAIPAARIAEEAARRRSFAIIAHPDAGKTTLTEKLLLKGGAIQLAGAVRAKGNARRTRSDWMKIEQDRGISVATSVMTFERDGVVFNLLDTPGHEDFSEDTYRTLTAVDAAVMVLDAAKGIESQTRKLFEVCRMRDIPIITFINKMDREAREPFELLDEIQNLLALDTTPAAWPVGRAAEFAGVYDLATDRFLPVAEGAEPIQLESPEDPKLAALVGDERALALSEEVLLARAGYPEFNAERFLEGSLTPVFFGSALRDFGIAHLLDGLARHAPPPRARPADQRLVTPGEEKLTGFVFKIQANMDPNHRDRVAFVRLCSGRLTKGMRLRQSRTGKQVPVNAPLFFFAKDRQVAEEAWPGDVIGIANHGTLRIGDTLTEGEALDFRGVPSFAPEILRHIRLDDPMLAKKLRTALDQLAEEGVVQLFRPRDGSPPVVGVVGQLQLDVLQSRLKVEYGVPAGFDGTPWEQVRWIASDEAGALERFAEANRRDVAEDHDGALVAFFSSDWRRRRAEEEWPMLRFHAVREQHGVGGGK
ncbi:MAG: hypothetical protein RLZZ57_1496 [Pseudomonadota bacterium]|jgi:peptide chain release factor 3